MRPTSRCWRRSGGCGGTRDLTPFPDSRACAWGILKSIHAHRENTPMRRHTALALAAVATLSSLAMPRPGQAQDVSRAAAGGGISVSGWQGKVDAQEERRGRSLNDAPLAQEGGGGTAQGRGVGPPPTPPPAAPRRAPRCTSPRVPP